MIIIVTEEVKLGTSYQALKDDNGKPRKFKTLSEVEEKLRELFESNPAISVIVKI